MTPHLKHVILGILVAVVLLVGTWKIVAHLDVVAHDKVVLDKAKLDADNALAQKQANQSATDALKNQADNQALKNQMASLTASNSRLTAQVASLTKQLADQRSQDAAMNANDLANRWAFLLSVPSSEFQTTPSSIVPSLTASHATVNALEEIPVVKQKLKDANDNSAEKDKTIQKQQASIESTVKLLTDKQDELNTCKQKITDSNKACNDKISAVKADARKRNFIINAAVFVLGLVVEHKLKF